MAIDGHYTIPGKTPLFVSEADQNRCRQNGAKTLRKTNRVWWQCDLCPKTGRGAGNLILHRRREHPEGA